MKFTAVKYRKWLGLIACYILAVGPTISGAQRPYAIPGQYIVVLKKGVRPSQVANAHGLKRNHTYSYALNGFTSRISAARLKALKKDRRVAFIEPDMQVFAFSQTVPTGVRRIGTWASSAAKIDGRDERVDVDIAILDTGIDLTHPDLNVYRAVSFSTNNTTGSDGNGHGTHVAGIAAALDNDLGVVGVAPGGRLWAIKVLDDKGSGSLSAVIKGVDYVTAHANEIEVANLSLGGLGSVSSLRTAIQNSIARGVVYVVAAGNSSYEIYGADATFNTGDDFFPASYPEVMTVSALADTDGQAGGTGASTSYGADDTLATFSNYSNNVIPDNPVSSPGAAVDVAAPGVNILSTYKGGSYAVMTGTSMASPHVAGAVALYISQHGRAFDPSGVARIRQGLIDSAEAQSSWGINPANPNPYKDFKPEGLVNVAAIAGTPVFFDPSTNPPVNHWPVVAITSPASGASFNPGNPITFSATASDVEDGNIAANVSWTSSINGQIGTGANCSANLSSGTHTITARVSDSAGSPANATITVSVIVNQNQSPTIAITSPAADSSFAYGTAIPFAVTASDAEDSDLSTRVSWTSSINGYLTTGSNFLAPLSSGTHVITAQVTDSGGSSARATITVTVGNNANNPPAVSITSPASGSTYATGTEILFSALASDVEDGDLTGRVTWSSSIDGQITTAGSFTVILSPGTHTITARVTDSAGTAASAVTTIIVGGNLNNPPTLAVVSPAAGSTYAYGAEVRFAAVASDPEDGDLSGRILWTSSLNGYIGTSGAFLTSLGSGTHNITAQVTDSAGVTASTSFTITINPPPMPTLKTWVGTDKALYANRNVVATRVLITDNLTPVSGSAVHLVIRSPNGKTFPADNTSNSAGVATFSFTINSKRDGIGVYSVTATASKAGYNSSSSSTTFSVR